MMSWSFESGVFEWGNVRNAQGRRSLGTVGKSSDSLIISTRKTTIMMIIFKKKGLWGDYQQAPSYQFVSVFMWWCLLKHGLTFKTASKVGILCDLSCLYKSKCRPHNHCGGSFHKHPSAGVHDMPCWAHTVNFKFGFESYRLNISSFFLPSRMARMRGCGAFRLPNHSYIWRRPLHSHYSSSLKVHLGSID